MVMTQSLPEFRDVDPRRFREEIVPAYRPYVLRGLVGSWPAVQAGLDSPEAFAGYLKRLDLGRPVETFVGPPEIEGRFFYAPDLAGFNFERRPQRVGETLDLLLSLAGQAAPPSVYCGSAPMADHLPAFQAENRLDLVDPATPPRLWIGNAVSVAAHYDLSDNIACVVAGRRRFTLFPPEQVVNLYVGPLEHTLAGQPISMAPLDVPDFERYPRFAQALEAAQTAVLEPGDAIYIPTMWWHAVRALEPVNALVNYWWDDQPDSSAPFEALVHAILGVRDLPAPRREAWRAMFEHYVFQTGDDPAAHLAPDRRGVLGKLTPDLRRRIKSFLMYGLNRS
jgi:hypothetical protein